ncbi:MAG: outer membrane lipid asymmetry maintenance protein MlaD [Pseudomonadota bacterium]
MRRSSVEIAVGVFVVIGIFCVGYLTIQLGEVKWFGDNTYSIFGRFESVSGLKIGASVEIAGIPVGSIHAITLDHERQMAVVEMKIDKDVGITDDVIASVKTSGLIGDKFVKLTPGGSPDMLGPGDMIVDTESALDIEELVSKYVFGKV